MFFFLLTEQLFLGQTERWGVCQFCHLNPPEHSYCIWATAYVSSHICRAEARVADGALVSTFSLAVAQCFTHHPWSVPHTTGRDRPEVPLSQSPAGGNQLNLIRTALLRLSNFAYMGLRGEWETMNRYALNMRYFSKFAFYLHLFKSFTCMFYFLNKSNQQNALKF